MPHQSMILIGQAAFKYLHMEKNGSSLHFKTNCSVYSCLPRNLSEWKQK